MLSTLPAPILLGIAILFTALSWGLRAYLVDKGKTHGHESSDSGYALGQLGRSHRARETALKLLEGVFLPTEN
jgi:hypothetical protein